MAALMLLSVLTAAPSCLKEDDKSIVLDSGVAQDEIAGIPGDHRAEPSPSVNQNTTVIPNVQYTTEIEGDDVIVRLDMTGVQDPETLEWLRLVGTGGEDGDRQNVWVEVDGKPKGIDVYNTIDDEEDANVATVKNDFVFLVDNSGSMSEEADAIARDIIDWATELNANLDVRFGCIGYNGNISGAIDITTSNELKTYLERQTGTSRTVGYGSSSIENAARSYSSVSGECGTLALRFADEKFSFRSGANRIYVNFTDESNQPGGSSSFSVEYVNPATNNWSSAQGTIHTIFSGTLGQETVYTYEDPCKMSVYTGGTSFVVGSDFAGVTLSDLPVTKAMQNSYVIRFTNVEEFMDGMPHEVKVTIVSADGHVQAERSFTIVFGK